MNPIQSPLTQDLLDAIEVALSAHPVADGIHLSIEPHGREVADDDGATSYMKAVCWNLTVGKDQDGEEEAMAVLVDEDLTEELIRAELVSRFPKALILVDNDILVEDENSEI